MVISVLLKQLVASDGERRPANIVSRHKGGSGAEAVG
jgi:hypothetical protein